MQIADGPNKHIHNAEGKHDAEGNHDAPLCERSSATAPVSRRFRLFAGSRAEAVRRPGRDDNVTCSSAAVPAEATSSFSASSYEPREKNAGAFASNGRGKRTPWRLRRPKIETDCGTARASLTAPATSDSEAPCRTRSTRWRPSIGFTRRHEYVSLLGIFAFVHFRLNRYAE